ncbi:hypothetical protein LTR85_001109 [Meristemomyces frigidus]|nr:hypothetical protein LTR85_001109 [Meristemomyces frigidus]
MLSLRADGNDALSDFVYYHYRPSMAAAIIFIVLFGLATSLHVAQMLRTRTWFMIPFVIGGIFETVGYVGRALSAGENPGPYTTVPYVMQSLLLLVAPALFAASIYMELSRIVLMVGGDKALFIRRTWLTKIFVIGDVVSFLAQCGGGGMLASGNKGSINTGKLMVVAGLIVQLIFFGLFVTAAASFHIRISRAPTQKCRDLPWWRKHMISLYIVSFLIFVRSIVRVVEYLQGYNGYIMSHEVFIYVFDGTMMWLAVATMNAIHPGEVAKQIKTARMGSGRGGMAGEQLVEKDGESRERDGSLPTSAEEWVQDMELMHHYSNYVANEMITRVDFKILWKETIPNEALRHPFLLHGLLALAALSLACLRPAETTKYLNLCDKHQTIALAGYRNVLSHTIEQDVSSALFAQASIISVTSMARACTLAGAKPPPRLLDMEDVTELFLLTRGVRDVIMVARDHILKGPLAIMFWGHNMPSEAESSVTLPDSVRSEFDRLEEMLQRQCHPENLGPCASALVELIDIYRNIQYFALRSEVNSGHVIRWLTMVPSEYVRLIEQRDQPALVVLAYFAAAMASVRTVWYTKDWSTYALQGVRTALSESMQHWLQWPEEQLRTDLAVLMRGTPKSRS